MWTITKRTARQKEIRRTKAERLGSWRQRMPDSPAVLALLSTLVTAVVAVAILNLGGEVMDLRFGQVVPRAITARVELNIEDRPQTEQLRLRARDRSPNYYKLDVSLIEMIRGRLDGVLTLAKAHREDPDTLVKTAAENQVFLDEAGRDEILRLAALENADGYDHIVTGLIARLKPSPLVEPESAGTRRTPGEAILFDPTIPLDSRKEMTALRFSNDPAAVDKIVDDAVRWVPEPLQPSFRKSLLAMLGPVEEGQPARPLYRYDTSRTVSVAEQAMSQVEPVVYRYAVGDPLADAGVIDDEEIKLLRAEQAEFARVGEPNQPGWLRDAARTMLVFFVVLGVAAYMRRYQHGVFANHLRRVASMAVLLLILGVTRAMFIHADIPPEFAIGMQVLAAGLLGVVYADEAVFAICGALALLISMAVHGGIAFLVILLAASGMMVFGLRVVRNRGKIVLVGAASAAVAFVATIAVGLLGGQQIDFVLVGSMWAGGSVLMAGFFAEGVLPGIERLFRLSTGMTLLEWCDASKPLMRMLAAEAPGTYNHSRLVGSLAESAADAIGANGLLCRAGCYYHDIGKINKPGYFVENQAEGISRHDRLSPAMSLLVIIGHVKDGIEMAREYGLPAVLRPFISEHHGTTLVQYFYHAASKSRKPDDPEISDTEFRYPGPKPQSRETAIVMLCDGVEGAVRAMSEPTPNRIETVVADLVRKRLADGQFDECDLTFRELAVIEKSLVKSLCGIYHSRIVYPGDEKEKSAAS